MRICLPQTQDLPASAPGSPSQSQQRIATSSQPRTFLNNSFLKYNSSCQAQELVNFIVFTELCNHLHYIIPELSPYPYRTPEDSPLIIRIHSHSLLNSLLCIMFPDPPGLECAHQQTPAISGWLLSPRMFLKSILSITDAILVLNFFSWLPCILLFRYPILCSTVHRSRALVHLHLWVIVPRGRSLPLTALSSMIIPTS